MKNLSNTGIFALLLCSSLTIMVGTVIAPSLTEVSVHLGFTRNPGWLITLPALGVVLFAPIAGKLMDRKGPYTLMCWGLIPYALFGVIGIWLSHPIILIADRILLGAATAAIQTSGTGLIAHFFENESRIKMIAWQGMAIESGGVLFLSLGGILAELNWQYPFFIYLIAILCLFLVRLSIPKVKAMPNSEKQLQSPTIPKNMIQILSHVVMAMILFFIVVVGLPQYLPHSFGFSTSLTGYFMAFISIIAVCTASIVPLLIRQIGSKYTLATGFGFFAAAHLLYFFSGHISYLILAAIATGTGFGFTIPLLNHLTLEESTFHNRGRNLGYYSMGIFGGQFLSSFIELLSLDMKTTFLIAATIGTLVAANLFYQARKTAASIVNNNFNLNK
ncbi:MFS transporter [Pedobacter steynii]|uniref:Permease n=1 Tax=Pedobacter steynii TaxID=430522 RepID=A0A1D7QC60_9SPHI|nr:MFS transporter [Pedobacter steynii]AOM76280.1 permease [Pedobacter steynii]